MCRNKKQGGTKMNKELDFRLNKTKGCVCPNCKSFAIMPTIIWGNYQCSICGKTGTADDFPKHKEG